MATNKKSTSDLSNGKYLAPINNSNRYHSMSSQRNGNEMMKELKALTNGHSNGYGEHRLSSSPQSSCGSISSNFATTFSNCSVASTTSGSITTIYSSSNGLTKSVSNLSNASVKSMSVSSCYSSSQCDMSDCSNSSVMTYHTSYSSDETNDDTKTTTMTTRSSASSSNSCSSSIGSSFVNNSICTASSTSAQTRSLTRKNSQRVVNCQHTHHNNSSTSQNNNTSNSVMTNGNHLTNGANTQKCLWNDCNYVGISTNIDDSLIEHLKSKHIYSQKKHKRFRCLWTGCNVYNYPSCSFNWLERHVVDHIDTKPFLCIFNGCKRKFRTEAAREQHVQWHIKTTDNQAHSSNGNAGSGSTQSPTKTRNNQLLKTKLALIKTKSTNSLNKAASYTQLLKTLTKKRKQISNAKKFKKVQYKDFFEKFSVKILENRLESLDYMPTTGKIKFAANIIGSKTNEQGHESFLIEWTPKNMLPNEWVERKNLQESKEMYASDLFKDKAQLGEKNPFYVRHRYRINKRK